MEAWQLAAATLLALLLALGVITALIRLRRRQPRSGPSDPASSRRGLAPPAPDPDLPRAAIIANPSKLNDPEQVRAELTATCQQHGWAPPLWLTTTVEDPGVGQAQAALAAGVDLVCALGGDGTVRQVASALVGCEVPLGLLPAGTGNLLARNLDLPLDSRTAALHLALTGADHDIDVGRVRYRPHSSTRPGSGEEISEHFLVMAGLGFDASMIADAPDALKAQIGYGAYVLSGLRHLYGPRFEALVSIDGGRVRKRRARTVLFANVGGLQGGITLLPTDIDDGRLDGMILSPRAMVEWASVAAHVLTRHRRGSALIDRFAFSHLVLRLREAQDIQVDGDAVGHTRSVRVDVLPRALRVRRQHTHVTSGARRQPAHSGAPIPLGLAARTHHPDRGAPTSD